MRTENFEGGDDAGDAVKFSAGGDGVDVGAAEPDGFIPGDGFGAGVEIAEGVDSCLAVGGVSLGDDVVAGLFPRGGERGTVVAGCGGTSLKEAIESISLEILSVLMGMMGSSDW